MARSCAAVIGVLASAVIGGGSAPLPAPATALSLSWTLPGTSVAIPRMLLGTGGGGGGYDAGAWLAAGGAGFDSAQTYCYTTARPFCSHVAISNALAAAPAVPAPFVISKVEPEDYGVLDVISGFGRVVDRGILQDLSLQSIDMIMMHQAGRSAGASNVRPACYNASAGAEGTYAVCRLQAFASFLALVKKGVARSAAVSNWVVRDLQQVFDAFGVFPSALEVRATCDASAAALPLLCRLGAVSTLSQVLNPPFPPAQIEVHPWWHEDELIAFAKSVNITIINYAPLALARPEALQDPTVVRIASAHGVTPAAVLLQWGLQFTGGVTIPRSANATHMRDNLALIGAGALTLSDNDMDALSHFPQKKILCVQARRWERARSCWRALARSHAALALTFPSPPAQQRLLPARVLRVLTREGRTATVYALAAEHSRAPLYHWQRRSGPGPPGPPGLQRVHCDCPLLFLPGCVPLSRARASRASGEGHDEERDAEGRQRDAAPIRGH